MQGCVDGHAAAVVCSVYHSTNHQSRGPRRCLLPLSHTQAPGSFHIFRLQVVHTMDHVCPTSRDLQRFAKVLVRDKM